MSEEVYGVSEGQHIPAAVLHRYLTDFAETFGIAKRTRFQTRVTTIEATDNDRWNLYITSPAGDEVVRTKKLIVATGLTSTPNMPSYPGQDTFTPPFFHAKDFCARADTVKTCKRATIVGAGKSAFDCAYAFAEQEGEGAQVDLIIRPTGQGPVWLCPPYVTPLKRKMEELLATRIMTWFSPCPWQSEDGFSLAHSFLHKTGIGRFLVDLFWNTISTEVIDTHGYHEDNELFKLKPWASAQWTGSGVGIHNYATNFFDLVRSGRIRVHIADITSLSGTTIHLSTGDNITTDVLIAATGWKKGSNLSFINYTPALPHTASQLATLRAEADQEVRTLFPGLKAQPTMRYDHLKDTGIEPLRNYRFIVPAASVPKRNIAFAGMVSTVCTSIFASVQGLWITAFFDGKLARSPKNEAAVLKEVMLHTQFEKWRYPYGYGAHLPDFAFDSLPYVDLLVNDLGLRCHRKGSQLQELAEAYKPWDYKGLVEEWVAVGKGVGGAGQ
jgi:cation diffusion facilitator CzcD-associated flavoprotein CzcO